MIVFEAFFGQCRILPDKNQELKLIQKVDTFLKGPRRALGRDRIIDGHPLLFRGGDLFLKGPNFFSGGEGTF